MTLRIIVGHVIDGLRQLADESVHCCVTSPPYYGLRSYGTEPQVWGEPKPICDHVHKWGEERARTVGNAPSATKSTLTTNNGRGPQPGDKYTSENIATVSQGAFCHCGAWRGDLGLEPTQELFIQHLVEIFREVRRVLRKDGTVFLNIGDSYASSITYNAPRSMHSAAGWKQPGRGPNARAYGTSGTALSGSRQSDLTSIRLCGACRDDLLAGRTLRSGRSPAAGHSPSPYPSSQVHTGSAHGHPAKSGLPGLGDRTTDAIPDSRLAEGHEAAPLHVVPASTLQPSSRPPPALCSPGQIQDDVCQSCGDSLSDYVPLSVCKTVCIDGTATQLDASGRRMSGKSSLGLAYPYYTTTSVKPKDLLMIPAQLALALRADGWYLRSEIIWAKKAPMPESVTDRPTCAHEKVFLLTKSARYFYDAEAVKEEAIRAGDIPGGGYGEGRDPQHFISKGWARGEVPSHRNMRNVWHLGPEPFPEAHFATFVSEIPRRAILAGTSAKGVCPKCGGPWVRVVEKRLIPNQTGGATIRKPRGNELVVDWSDYPRGTNDVETIGWRPSCSCTWNAPGAEVPNPDPATVLDPFLGSGTTAMVADQLGRHCIGIELSQSYAAMAERRLRDDAGLFADVAAE